MISCISHVTLVVNFLSRTFSRRHKYSNLSHSTKDFLSLVIGINICASSKCPLLLFGEQTISFYLRSDIFYLVIVSFHWIIDTFTHYFFTWRKLLAEKGILWQMLVKIFSIGISEKSYKYS